MEQNEGTADTKISTETVTERIARLALTDISTARLESLTAAHPHVDDKTFARISNALRVRQRETIVLPAQRFENLSRGKGWCRKGRGANAEWGERTDKGYEVGPGKWTVGGNDGFKRKGEDVWTVEHVQVGTDTWTIAN